MGSDRVPLTDGVVHPLPELLDRVLNSGSTEVRAGGWQVKRREKVIMIGQYDKLPESGGHIRNVAVFTP